MSKKLCIVLVSILICLVIICTVIFALPEKNNSTANDTPIANTDEPDVPSTVIKWNQVVGRLWVSYAASEDVTETVYQSNNDVFEYFGGRFLPGILINKLLLLESSHSIWFEPDGTEAYGGDVVSFEYMNSEGDISVSIFAETTPRQDINGMGTDFELDNSENEMLEANADTISLINGFPVILMETPLYSKSSGEYIRTELNAQFILDSQTDSENIFITVSCDRNLSKEDFIEIISEIINF